MTAKSMLVRPQGLHPTARASTCPPCYATAHQPWKNLLYIKCCIH